ncbi:hypothetical protein M409DRAFT_23924 [Zasmidium cellare ATCC 36951]|uniref:RING-type domain-containing protein n=1 Tax=Zasmidium cellare ATCC 36951 TaxID=1080233 RepID=A0A6A6CG59_ZASCE|nr:uncharacterized protein M409DRAFT_23924 [Zasmidium cellare ATCC 36951]KAF2165633.1 hypothetical protein M409DRAFT_23924 [Zasmidium cellare ATCC 36951]
MMASYTLRTAAALCALLGLAAAQSISPANATTANGLETEGLNDSLQLAIAHSPDSTSITVFPVAGLTSSAIHYTPNEGYRGPILLANASSQLSLDPQDVAFISCDPYTGNIQPSDVFSAAAGDNVSAIVLYSERSAGCMFNEDTNNEYGRVYSMRTSNSTKEMLELVNSLNTGNNGNNAQSAYAFVAPRDAISSTSSSNGTANGTGNGNQQQNALGPSPSTAVAMIILYSITGVITALFLIIIIMGAVRAHRHPERYGPRNGIGRPRQSRARGLAMAMLETIPIVKFGDREQNPKASDVELAEGQHGQVEVVPEQDAIRAAPNANATDEEANKDGAHETSREPQTPAAEDGIGGAVANEQPKPNEEHQGCSICTEDFQVGEDQRVLPCDHRFHPACIDPWLLNVSGTCPLCRIDLRPDNEDEDGPEDPDHILREGEPGEMPPPLAEQNDSRRASVRRSILAGVMGVRRPERMTREERVAALRQYRAQQNARTVAERHQSVSENNLETVAEGQEEEGETSVRRRLRNAFRIRTRRTGEEQQEDRDRRRDGTFAGGVGRA